MPQAIKASHAIVRTGKIAKWGNSPAIRIGLAALERAHIAMDQSVDVIATEDGIVIRPQIPRVAMADLLARFDPEKHRHALAFDTPPVGSETI